MTGTSVDATAAVKGSCVPVTVLVAMARVVVTKGESNVMNRVLCTGLGVAAAGCELLSTLNSASATSFLADDLRLGVDTGLERG